MITKFKSFLYFALSFTIIFFIIFSLRKIFLDTDFKNNKYTYRQTHERILDSGGQFFMYRISGISDKYFLATDKKLEDKNLQFLSNDKFWDPGMCAQMKTIVLNNKIYFFDSYLVNDDVNPYADILHIYDIESNILRTYRSDKHIDIYKATREGDKIAVYIRSNDKLKACKRYLNLETYEVLGIDDCTMLEFKDVDNEIHTQSDYKEEKPYTLSVFDSRGKTIIDLKNEEGITSFLIGKNK